MKIKITNEQELLSVATELAHVLSNLRKFQKLWNKTYGTELKERMKYYEKQADELIERLQITEHRTQSQIKIEVNKQL